MLSHWAEKFENLLVRNSSLYFFFIYTLSCGLMLVSNGIFWDDWHVHFLNAQAWDLYVSMDRPFHAILYSLFRNFQHSHYLINFVTFSALGITGFFFYKILLFCRFIRKEDAFWICALYFTFPQLYSRMCETISFFVIYLSCFTISTYYFLKSSEKTHFSKKIMIALGFFFSFGLESLLVFYSVPIGIRFLRTDFSQKKSSLASLKNFLHRHVYFLALPFVYFLVSRYLLTSSFLKSHPNSVGMEAFLKLPNLFYQSWYFGFIEPLLRVFASNKKYQELFLFLFLFSLFYFRKPDDIKKQLFNILTALILFIMSILPYNLTGKDIGYYYILDRNSIVSLFSCALLTYLFIHLFFSFSKTKWPKIIFIHLLLFFFVERNVEVYTSFLRAEAKQDSLIYYFQKNVDIQNGTTFILNDETRGYLAKDTPLDSSVTIGLLRSIFNTQTRCISDFPNECEKVSQIVIDSLLYNIQDYRPTRDQYKINIVYGSESLHGFKIYKWIFLKLTDPKSYEEGRINFLNVTTEKLTERT